MRLDMTAVDRKLIWERAGGRHFLENALPDTALGPTIVTVVNGRWWPIGWWNVAPAASCFQHMQDAGNDGPIVHARLSRLAMRQMGLQCLPCLIRQPKQIPCHAPPPATQIRAEIYHGINALYGFQPRAAHAPVRNKDLGFDVRRVSTSTHFLE
jgi:hypothetical protein